MLAFETTAVCASREGTGAVPGGRKTVYPLCGLGILACVRCAVGVVTLVGELVGESDSSFEF